MGIELELRFDRGERPLPSEYQRRFPGHAQLIDTAFSREAAEGSPAGRAIAGIARARREDRVAARGDRRADGRLHRVDSAAPHGQMLEFIVGSGERLTAIASLLSKRLRFLVWLIASAFLALILLVDLPKYWVAATHGDAGWPALYTVALGDGGGGDRAGPRAQVLSRQFACATARDRDRLVCGTVGRVFVDPVA